MKKKTTKFLDFLTTTITSFFFLIIAVAMTSGGLSVAGVSWLAWLEPAVPYVGWIFIAVIIFNVVMSTWNLFVKK